MKWSQTLQKNAVRVLFKWTYKGKDVSVTVAASAWAKCGFDFDRLVSSTFRLQINYTIPHWTQTHHDHMCVSKGCRQHELMKYGFVFRNWKWDSIVVAANQERHWRISINEVPNLIHWRNRHIYETCFFFSHFDIMLINSEWMEHRVRSCFHHRKFLPSLAQTHGHWRHHVCMYSTTKETNRSQWFPTVDPLFFRRLRSKRLTHVPRTIIIIIRIRLSVRNPFSTSDLPTCHSRSSLIYHSISLASFTHFVHFHYYVCDVCLKRK